MADKVIVGLVIAQPVKDSSQPLSEVEKYTQDAKPEVILFPEDHIYTEKLPDLQAIARERGKWIISGMQDREDCNPKFKKAAVVNPQGEWIGIHTKTTLS